MASGSKPSGTAQDASAALVLAWAHHARAALGVAREHLDALNVFPVPDGDTGTNLVLTVTAAVEQVEECAGDPQTPGAEAARAFAGGALLGARGNSGVILSQILRGMAEGWSDVLDGDAVRTMLHRASELAYAAVAHPVEGTILTVVRAAAEGAEAVAQVTDGASTVLDAALASAEEALLRTPTLLPALARAGVVDAGGQGLVHVLGALRHALAGDAVPVAPSLPELAPGGAAAAVGRGGHGSGERHYSGPAYEVMYLLEADDAAVTDLRLALDALGDSLVIVGGDGLWNVHVHVDDAGAAVEAGMRAGTPQGIRITHLSTMPGHHASERTDVSRAVVAVSHGPGVAALLAEAGIEVVPARPRVRPSTAELLGSIRATHAEDVVVLPSDSDTRGVAELAAQEARHGGLRVAVIPTRSIVQTLAAVAVHDPDTSFEDDVIAMTRAAGATRYGAVTIASRAALTTAGPCAEGDVLGVVDGDIVVVGSDVEESVREILSGMLAIGGELVTLVFGVDASEDDRQRLAAWVARAFPLVEVNLVEGDQPLWPVIVGVE